MEKIIQFFVELLEWRCPHCYTWFKSVWIDSGHICNSCGKYWP